VIELVVPKSSTAQGLPAEVQQQPEDHDVEDKANEEYPPLSDIEVESFGVEAPVPTGSLRSLLEHLGITTTPRYRIQEVPHPGWVEFKAIAEIFFGSRIFCRHKGPTFRASHSDAVADAAWQAITSWVSSNKSRLQNSVHHLLPYRKKDQFKAYGVKKDIPRMEMAHHQDVTVELSTRLLSAQREIETPHPSMECGRHHLRLHEDGRGLGQRPHTSDTDTWSATSSVRGLGKEPPVSSHSPSGSHTR
jgi:hypothetical protein